MTWGRNVMFPWDYLRLTAVKTFILILEALLWRILRVGIGGRSLLTISKRPQHWNRMLANKDKPFFFLSSICTLLNNDGVLRVFFPLYSWRLLKHILLPCRLDFLWSSSTLERKPWATDHKGHLLPFPLLWQSSSGNKPFVRIRCKVCGNILAEFGRTLWFMSES